MSLIENDLLVAAIFSAAEAGEGQPMDKIRAVIRAGKIAEAYTYGGLGYAAVTATFSNSVPTSEAEPPSDSP